MKHLMKLVSFAAILAVLLQPILAWATTNCYNIDTRPSNCHDNTYCHEQWVSEYDICKQLTIPYVDPGCCSYHRTCYIYGSQNNGICPCANKDNYCVFTNAVNTPADLCYQSDGTTIGACNTDVLHGFCQYTPGKVCGSGGH